MSINPVMSSCISVASLDQQVRLFDVRSLQSLPTTNDAPYNARAVDGEVLEMAENRAQIASHRARLACTSVDWDPTGTKLAAVSYDDIVKIWDLRPDWLNGKEEGNGGEKRSTPSAAKRKKTGLTRWIKGEDDDDDDEHKSDVHANGSDIRPDDLLAKPVHIPHNNQTGKWLTLFRARFNANPSVESHFSIGSMVRHAEIWSDEGTLLKSFYDEDYVTAVPAVTCTHPRRVGRLGTGNASGKCTFWAPPPL
jgi:WD40 repeat protein